MDEQKTNEKGKSEDTAEAENAGAEEKTISELDRADQIAERQKRENDRREALLIREENLAARKAVGGQTEAGQQTPKPEEISDEEYSKRAVGGEFNKSHKFKQ